MKSGFMKTSELRFVFDFTCNSVRLLSPGRNATELGDADIVKSGGGIWSQSVKSMKVQSFSMVVT